MSKHPPDSLHFREKLFLREGVNSFAFERELHVERARPNENKMSHRANYEWRSCANKTGHKDGSRLAPSLG